MNELDKMDRRIGGSLESVYGSRPHWRVEWDVVATGEHKVQERTSAPTAEEAILSFKQFLAREPACRNHKATLLEPWLHEINCVNKDSKEFVSEVKEVDEHHFAVKILDIDTTEEYVLNPEALPMELRGWRKYRIEYGGPNEACVWEGSIMLPPRADSEALVQLLMGMQAYGQIWTSVEDKPKCDKCELPNG